MTRECASVWDAEQTSASVSGMYRRPVCVFTRDVAQTTARVTSSWIIYSRLLPPCVCAGRDETLLTASSPGSNAIGRRERKQEDANWEVTQRTQTSSRAKSRGGKTRCEQVRGLNLHPVWKNVRQSTFPLSLSKSQFVDEEIQRHTVIRPIFWCPLDILDMLASWYEFIAYTLQKAACVANTDPR